MEMGKIPPRPRSPRALRAFAFAIATTAIAALSLRAESGTTTITYTNTNGSVRVAMNYALPDSAMMGMTGTSVSDDMLEKMLRKQAEAGDHGAQSWLGQLYFAGEKGFPKDQHEAVKWFQKAADGGDVAAQKILGDMYFGGLGDVEKNMGEALRLYRAAADQGFLPAQQTLGFIYINGASVPQNFDEAARWYKKAAAEHDDAGAKAALFDLLSWQKINAPSPAEFLDWCHAAAAAGNPRAQYMLFDAYDAGNYGVTRDEAEAKKWRDKLATQNDAVIQFRLSASAAENRPGHPADAVEAVKWLLTAAENKDRQLALNIDYLFRIFASGPRPDQADALSWLTAQAGQNRPWALFFLGTLYAHNIPGLVVADKNKSQELFRKADAAGMPAQLELARMYGAGIAGRPRWGEKPFTVTIENASDPAKNQPKP